MFNKLIDFSYERSLIEALGFYISYLILGLILVLVIGGAIGLSIGLKNTNDEWGYFMGRIIVIIFVLALSFLILYKKKLLSNLWLILLALSSIVLADFGGIWFGMIIPAFFTTKQSRIISELGNNTR